MTMNNGITCLFQGLPNKLIKPQKIYYYYIHRAIAYTHWVYVTLLVYLFIILITLIFHCRFYPQFISIPQVITTAHLSVWFIHCTPHCCTLLLQALQYQASGLESLVCCT